MTEAELVDGLSTATPLSACEAQRLIDAHGLDRMARLVAEGVPWYLLDAAGQASEVSTKWGVA